MSTKPRRQQTTLTVRPNDLPAVIAAVLAQEGRVIKAVVHLTVETAGRLRTSVTPVRKRRFDKQIAIAARRAKEASQR